MTKTKRSNKKKKVKDPSKGKDTLMTNGMTLDLYVAIRKLRVYSSVVFCASLLFLCWSILAIYLYTEVYLAYYGIGCFSVTCIISISLMLHRAVHTDVGAKLVTLAACLACSAYFGLLTYGLYNIDYGLYSMIVTVVFCMSYSLLGFVGFVILGELQILVQKRIIDNELILSKNCVIKPNKNDDLEKNNNELNRSQNKNDLEESNKKNDQDRENIVEEEPVTVEKEHAALQKRESTTTFLTVQDDPSDTEDLLKPVAVVETRKSAPKQEEVVKSQICLLPVNNPDEIDPYAERINTKNETFSYDQEALHVMASDRIDTSYLSHLDVDAADNFSMKEKNDTTVLPQSSLAFDQFFLADTTPPQPADKKSKSLAKSLSSISLCNSCNDEQPAVKNNLLASTTMSRYDMETNENVYNPYAS